MIPKPEHLGREYGEQFSDQSVVDHYHLRPAYPTATFDILNQLVAGTPRTVLDVGTGTGEIARPLATMVDHVHAVDLAPAMIERARQLPGGDSDRITWIVAPLETAPLNAPYGLVTAAASLHWMEWDVVLPRFRDVLAPGGVLAIITLVEAPVPWSDRLMSLIQRASTNRTYRSLNIVDEIAARGLFRTIDRVQTRFESRRQSVGDYIGAIHARNGFSLDRMNPADAAAFDRAVHDLVAPFAMDGEIGFEVASEVTWGEPLPRREPA